MLNTSSPEFSSALLAACQEARRWLGATAPNPPVGAAALDEKGEIIALAAHQKAGGDHAEAALLKLCRAQEDLPRLHTLCVTLEPCNHTGRTPPCTEAIIAAGVRRVVIGARDPNPFVTGGGVERLRQAGIEVIENVENEACRRLIHAFAFHANTGRPFVTVKRAFDAQGSMIPPVGQKTFTSPESLSLAHRLRKKADAILTGSGTILADHPMFTIRHVPDHPDKRRILAILDRRGRVPKTYIEKAAERGLDVVIYQSLDSCIFDLENRGIRDVLVESGPTLSRFVLDSPFWTMKVDIHHNVEDRIEIGFNQNAKITFDCKKVEIESLLPF
ncbi:MAG: bifunctional diaminohydroxyphosphoribosylaminopyrimidine deaminase/5-amino-6-(5-phosphoribosylamino)uracil reductase RibD [Alphaproteobacteria bacterium]|nr:bifunctional diaminohydroxyphosphoribosylaminopyrimidine deaminase/5-amino-6-(5-phosphoribosylamino)uracil reductase RibD [Alphaproteobacteria bacterium]